MSSNTPLYQNLDTTFVNLWSLLRKLTEQGFIGRVHVELEDYSADVFLDGSSTPLVREIDRAANTDTVEQGALHRVVLRARETPGTISVFAGADEATVQRPAAAPAAPPVKIETSPATNDRGIEEKLQREHSNETAAGFALPAPPSTTLPGEAVYRTGSYDDWPAILAVTGELVGAIERAINAAGADFLSIFNGVCLELADDYVFLDPIAQRFQYSQGVATLKDQLAMNVFISGLSEALRRTIDRVAVGERARRVRERVALEMLPVARRRTDVLERSGLSLQLDRIAGTIVM